jgi:predicted Zn-dependent protease
MPQTEKPQGEAVSLYDMPWDFWQDFAHKYGSGPVTVFVKNPKSAFAAAIAVRRWNQATGVPVFRLATSKEDADVVVKTKVTDKFDFNSGDALPSYGDKSTSVIRLFEPEELNDLYATAKGAQWKNILIHELGHTVGLGHSTSGVMGGYSGEISQAEAGMVNELVEPQVAAGKKQAGGYTTRKQQV